MMYVLHTMYMMHTMYLMHHDQKFVRLPPSSTCDKSCDTQLLFQQLVNKVPTTNLSHSVFIIRSPTTQSNPATYYKARKSIIIFITRFSIHRSEPSPPSKVSYYFLMFKLDHALEYIMV